MSEKEKKFSAWDDLKRRNCFVEFCGYDAEQVERVINRLNRRDTIWVHSRMIFLVLAVTVGTVCVLMQNWIAAIFALVSVISTGRSVYHYITNPRSPHFMLDLSATAQFHKAVRNGTIREVKLSDREGIILVVTEDANGDCKEKEIFFLHKKYRKNLDHVVFNIKEDALYIPSDGDQDVNGVPSR